MSEKLLVSPPPPLPPLARSLYTPRAFVSFIHRLRWWSNVLPERLPARNLKLTSLIGDNNIITDTGWGVENVLKQRRVLEDQ